MSHTEIMNSNNNRKHPSWELLHWSHDQDKQMKDPAIRIHMTTALLLLDAGETWVKEAEISKPNRASEVQLAELDLGWTNSNVQTKKEGNLDNSIRGHIREETVVSVKFSYSTHKSAQTLPTGAAKHRWVKHQWNSEAVWGNTDAIVDS